MEVALNIDLTYFEGPGRKNSFLAPYLTAALEQLDSAAKLHTSAQVRPTHLIPRDRNSGISSLQETLIEVMQTSSIWLVALREGEWYINVVVVFRHSDASLGIMFDTFSTRNSCCGCAVFEQDIMDLSHINGVPFDRLVTRTVLYEIGYCLNLAYDEEIRIIYHARLLICSPKAPRWYHNITYNFSAGNHKFL